MKRVVYVTLTTWVQRRNVTLNVDKGSSKLVNDDESTWKRYAECGQRFVFVTLTTWGKRGHVTLDVGKGLSTLRYHSGFDADVTLYGIGSLGYSPIDVTLTTQKTNAETTGWLRLGGLSSVKDNMQEVFVNNCIF